MTRTKYTFADKNLQPIRVGYCGQSFVIRGSLADAIAYASRKAEQIDGDVTIFETRGNWSIPVKTVRRQEAA